MNVHHDASVERTPANLSEGGLIVIHRNPIDRAYSQYWMNRSRMSERLTFEEAIEAEADTLRQTSRPDSFRYSYVDRGRLC